MALIVICRCGTEHDASDGLLCRPCQADAACAADRAELLRLWRKRERYRARGVSPSSTDQQAVRVRLRMERRCQQIEPNPEKAHEMSSRQARLAGEARSRLVTLE